MDCYLGVDGGGTKTRFALVDADERLLAEAQCTTTYHPQVGLDGMRATLADGIGRVLHVAGRMRDAIRHAFFGLPVYSEDSRVALLLGAIPRELLGHDRYACDNDMPFSVISAKAGIHFAFGTRHWMTSASCC